MKAGPARKRRAVVEEIEPRILYSADFAPGLVDAAVPAPAAEERVLDPSGEFAHSSIQAGQTRRHEIVFVDPATPDYEKLIADIQARDGERDIEVVLLDAGKDGIRQITKTLAGREDIGAVHIVSHGSDGSVQLGKTSLNFDSLLKNGSKIKGWGDALTSDADILIYGCNVAQSGAGQSLIDALARLTGADVAASDDTTGAASQGGDWTLEYQRGEVQVQLIFDQSMFGDWSETLQAIAAGVETRANATTTGIQDATVNGLPRAVATDANGNFVVVWASNTTGQDGSGYGIYAQRFNAAGATVGSQFRVNTYTNLDQTMPSVAMDANGNFVVAWISNGQDGDVLGVYAQRFNASGATVGTEFRVNSITASDQFTPIVAMNASGNFVVMWTSSGQDGSGYGVFAKRYNASGVAQSGDLQINSNATGDQWPDGLVVDAGGNFIATFASSDPGGWGVYAARYDLGLNVVLPEVRVNSTTAADQDNGAIAMDSSGNYVVVWRSAGQDGSGTGIYAQRYNASGTKIGGEFLVNTTTAGNQTRPEIAMDAGGRFVVTWSSDAAGAWDVYQQEFHPNGTANGVEVRVNGTLGGDQQNASVSMTAQGDFVVAWSGNGTGDTDGVFFQRYINSGVTVTPTSGLTTTEAGGAATFSVVLDRAPTSNVTISLASSDTTEGTIPVGSLTFTTGNWSVAQNVTVTGVDDAFSDGAIGYTIVTGATVSADPNYSGLAVADVSVTNSDTTPSEPARTFNEDGSQVFSAAGGNAVNVTDGTTADGTLRVQLTVTNGIFTLSQTTGLTFISGADGSSTMTVQGLESSINAALNGSVYTPTANYNGSASLQVTTTRVPDVIAQYTFENSGSLGADSTGTYNGTVGGSGTTGVVDPVHGNVASLTGSGYVQIGGRFANPASVTLGAWVNLTAADAGGADVISLGDSVALRLDDSVGGVTGFMYNGTAWQNTRSSQFVAGTGWHYVAYTFDNVSKAATLYLDGTVVASATLTGSITYNQGANSHIGRHGNGGTTHDFNGRIEDVRVYNRALSAAEIAALASDANGPTQGVAITVIPVNDEPTLTATTSTPTFTEGGSAVSLFSAAAVSTVEGGQSITRLDLTVSNVSDGAAERLTLDGTVVQLTNGASGTTADNAMSYTVSLAGSTATVSLTKAAGVSSAATQMLVNGIAYQNTSQDPTAGARTVTLTRIDDSGSNTAPNDNTATLAVASTVTVAAVNDQPTLTATTSTPTFTEGGSAVVLFSAAAVSTVEAGQSVTRLDLTVSNVSDGAAERLTLDGTVVQLTNGASGTTATNSMSYTVSVAGSTATVSLTKAVGVSTGAMQTLVNGIAYENTSQDPTAGARTVTLTRVDDSGSNSAPNDNTAALAIASTVTVAAVNDQPTLTATTSTPTFTEGGSAVVLFSAAAVSTVEAGQSITRLDLTVSNVSDGAAERLTLDGTIVQLTNGASGTTATNSMSYTVSVAGSTATVSLTKAAGVSTGAMQTLVNGIAYENTSQDPTAGARTVTLTRVDDSGSNSAPNDNTATLAIASTVTVAAVNDQPTLTATTSTPTFTEGGSAVVLFSAAAVSTVEAGQSITRLDLTVSNVSDGAAERLSLDGTIVQLTNGASGTTATNSMSYTVSVAGSTATVSLTKAVGVSTGAMQTLVNGIAYENTSQDPTAGARTVTLTRVDDSGSNSAPNDNTATVAIASTVTVAAVNDQPTLTATTSSPTFTEGGSAVSLFSAAAVSTVEAGQSIARLDLTVSNVSDGASERLSLDGTIVQLTNGASGTTATNSMSYTVSVAGSTATVSLTKAAGVSTGAMQALVNGVAYENTSQDPTAGARTVTLTRIDDSGSNTAPNDNTATLAIASTVTVAAVNDEPTLTATISTPTFTEGDPAVGLFSAAAVSTVESGQSITRLDLTVSNVSDGAAEQLTLDGTIVQLTNGASGTTATNSMSYTVSVAGSTATVSLSKAVGVTGAALQTLVDAIAYENTSQDPTAGARTVTLARIDDSGSNGAPNDNTAALAIASTVTVAAVNDQPTLTATTSSPTFTEGGSAVALFSAAAVSTVEVGQSITRLDLTVSNVSDGASERLSIDGTIVQVTNGASGTTATNSMSYTVSVAGSTATVSLTKAAGVSTGALQTLVNGIAYENSSQDPTAGARTVTLTRIDDSGSNTAPNDNTASLAIASTVTVAAVNDEPTLTATTSTPTFTEGGSAVALFSAAAVSTVEAGQSIARLDLTVSNVSDGASERLSIDGTIVQLTNGASGTTATNSMSYTVSVAGSTATVSLTKAAGVTSAALQTLVDAIAYENTSQDPTAGARTVTLTRIDDSGSNSAPDDNTTTLAIASTVTVAPVNDEPTLTATTSTPTFTEGGSAVSLFSAAAVSTVEAGQSITRLDLTVSNVSDGAAERLTLDGTVVQLTNGASGTTATNSMSYTVSVAGSTATVSLTKAAGVTSAALQTLVDGISYENTSQDPTAGARTVTLTRIDDSGSNSAPDDNTASLAIASSVTVAAVNDEPTLTASTSSPTFTAGDPAVVLFSAAAVSTVEAGQSITRLDLTVSNVSDGGAEQLTLDGTIVQLTNGASGTTAGNSMSYTVSVAGSTATVSLTKAAGVSTGALQTLVDAIAYENTSPDPTAGARTVTLSRIDDSGSNTAPNDNTASLAIASTVTVAAVNDEPTLTASTSTPSFIEGDPAVALFSAAVVSTVESGQSITRLDLTVSNVSDGAAEQLSLDGTIVQLTNGASGTTATNSMSYTVSVAGSTATVSLTNAAGVSSAAMQTLVDAIAYENTSQDPTAGARTVTLSRMDDSGSNTAPNDNTATLAIASTVTVAAVNDEPTLTATTSTPTFTEGGSAVSLFSAAAVSTVEAGQSVTRLDLTVSNVSDGAAERLSLDGTIVQLTNGASGTTATNSMSYTVSVAGSTATVTLSKAAGVSTATLQTLVDTIAYENTGQDPTAGARTVTLTRIDDSGASAAPDDNTASLAITSTVTVVAVNDEPTLTATTSSPTFTEGDPAVALFSSAAVSTVEAGQSITRLDLTVSNVSDGAAERLTLDGTVVQLTNGASGTTAGNSMSYTVSVAGSTATVSLTKAAGVTSAALQTLVDAIAYENTSQDPTAGARTITLTRIDDSGSNSAPSDNTASLAIASTMTVAAVDDEPTLTATGSSPTFTEGDPAVALFSAAAVSTVESGQSITRLDLTVSNVSDGAAERLSLDGTIVQLTNGASGTTTTNSMSYTVSVVGSTATVSLTKAAGVSSAAMQTLVDGIAYENTSQDPTAGARTVTLTRIDDSGANSAPDDNTTTLAIASTATVAAANDAPVVTAGAVAGYTENAAAVVIDNTITMADADDTQISGATVTISTGLTAGDLLGFVDMGNITGSYDAGTGVLTLSGTDTLGTYQAALRSVTYSSSSEDPTAGSASRTISWQVTDADSDGAGAATSVAVTSTVNITAVNDEPTLTATTSTPSFTEGDPAVGLFSAAAVSTVESGQSITRLDLTVSNVSDGAAERLSLDGTTVQLTNGASGTTATNAMSYTVSVAGSTATVSVTKAAGVTSAALQTLVDGISYENASQDPTAGARTVTLTRIDDSGSNSAPNDNTASLAIASTVTVAAVNDEPTLTATPSNPSFTEGGSAVSLFSAAAVSTVEAGQSITQLDLTVSNVSDGAAEQLTLDGTIVQLTNGASGTTATNSMSYTVSVAGSTATVSLTKAAGVTSAALQTLVDGITYENTSQDPTAGARTVTLTRIDDSGSNSAPDDNTAALAIASTVTVAAVNDEPMLTATGSSPTFTEGGSAVALFSAAVASTVESGQSITRLDLTVSNVSDGAAERLTLDGTIVQLTNGASGTTAGNSMSYTVSVAGSTATLSLTRTAGVSTGALQTLVDGITYENTSQDPTAGARTITLTRIDDSGSNSAPNDNTATVAIASTVTVAAVNDQPTLTASTSTPTFTEGGSAVALFSAAAMSTVESGQSITRLDLTVSNVSDGASERLTLDGTVVQLTNGASGTTATNSMSYTVSVAGSTATVSLTKAAGVTSAQLQTLVDAIAYENTSQDPTAGARTVTLTRIDDSGSNTAPNDNTATLAIASTVTVAAVNDEPTLTATISTPTFTEGDPAVGLFSAAAVSTVESGQSITRLDLTVSNVSDGAAEQLTLDGTIVQLTNGASGTTATNSMSYTVSVAGSTATVSLTKAAGVSTGALQTLVNGVAYENSSQDPTAGARTVTLTRIDDSGSNTAPNDNTASLAIASTVTVAAVNDEPTLTATTSTPTFTEGGSAVALFSAAAVSTVEAGQSITRLDLTVSNVSDGASEQLSLDGTTVQLTNGASGTTATNSMSYTVSVAGSTATVSLTKAAGVSTGAMQTLVNGVAYENTSQDPTAGARTVTLTRIDDSGSNSAPNDNTAALAIASTVTVAAVNDQPTLTATTSTPTFTEGGSAVALFSAAAVSTVEGGQSITRLDLTVSNVSDGVSERVTLDGTIVQLTNGASGTTATNSMSYTVSVAGSTATVSLTKAAGVTSAALQTLVDGISYENTSQDPTAGARTVTLTRIDDSGSSTAPNDNTATVAIASTVTVVAVNDQPTLTASTSTPTFTEGDPAVGLFSAAAVSTVEAGQSVTRLDLTVSNVSDGASEQLTLDGTIVQLTNGASGTTATNSMSYTVSVAGSTATVSLSKAAGVTSAALQTLVDAIAYENTSQDPTAGARTVTLTRIDDSGSNSAPDDNTASLAIASTVTVAAVNDQPTLTATTSSPTFTEGGSAVSLFSAGAVSTVEAGQSITRLDLTVSNVSDAASERLTLDGTVVQLTNGASGTTVTNSMSYTVSVAGSTATVSLTKAAGVSSAATQTLVDGISYENTSQDPTAGARTVTLTRMDDSGSNTAPNDNTATLAIASTVTVVAVNDEPTLTATTSTPTFTEGGSAVSLFSAAAVSTVEAGQSVTRLDLTVSNVSDGAAEQLTLDGTIVQLTNGASGTTATNSMSYTVSVAGSTATVSLTKAAGVSTGAMQTLVNGVAYENTSQDPTAGARTVTLTRIDDSGASAAPDDNTASLAIASTVTVAVVNDEPTLTAITSSPTFTEGDPAVALFSAAAVSTVDSGQSITRLDHTVSNVSDGAAEQLSLDGTIVQLTNGASGTTAGNAMSYTVSVSGSTATVNLTKAAGVTSAALQTLVDAIAYENTSQDPTAGARTVTLTRIDDSGSNSAPSDNTTTLAIASSVTVAAVNDEPTLTATGSSPTFTEGGSAVALFSAAAVSTVEAGQSITRLDLTVSNVSDGAAERLTLDGTIVQLTNGASGTTAGNSMSYTVSLAGSTATVSLTKAAGVTSAALQTLVDGISYENTSQDPTAGARTVTLTRIDDSGSSTAPNDNTASLAIASTVTVAAVNDAPVAVDDGDLTDEDTVLSVAVAGVLGNDSDVDGGALTVSAVEGNPAAVGSALPLGSGALLTLNADGSFSYDPNGAFEYLGAGESDVDTFTYELSDGNGGLDTATVSITIDGVNDAPGGGDATVVIDEDASYIFTPADFGFADADASDSLQGLRLVSLPGAGSLSLSGAGVSAGQLISAADLMLGNLVFTPAADANAVGYASFTFRVNDGTVDAPVANTLSIDVIAVNDAPGFTQAGAQNVNEDAGAQIVGGFANALPGGGGDEAGQTLSYSVSNDNNALFSVQPGIDAAGNLTYTLAADASGVANVTVLVSDNGGTANGGADTSAAQLFTITVNAVNDAPTLTIGANQIVAEDGGAQSVAGFAAAAPGGGADEAGQVLSYVVSNDNNALFALQPALDAAGNLVYTPAADASGVANVTVLVGDNGGTANGGVDSSGAQIFTITVNPVNDAPLLGANVLSIGQGGVVVLGAANLSASDVDDSAAGLMFSVSNVLHGRFELVSTPGAAIAGFSQADLTAGLVRFIHDGSGTAAAYAVSVSDGLLSDGPQAASISFTPSAVLVMPPAPVLVPVVNPPPAPAIAPASAPEREAPAGARAGVTAAVFSPGRIDPPEAQLNDYQAQPLRLGRVYQPVATLNHFTPGPHIDPTLELLAAAPANLEYLSTVPVDWTSGAAFPDAEETPRDRIDVLLEQVQVGGMALSVGVVWWASRISGLLGSLLASAPAWRHIDPLPVVGRDEDEEKKWYDTEDRDADANELAIDDVFEGAHTAKGEQQA